MAAQIVVHYLDRDGESPFGSWFRSIRDRTAQAAILRRADRLAAGNPGNVRYLRGGVSELKVSEGPGYRIYFGQIDQRTVMLLCGGDKGSQDFDIERAVRYLDEWKMRNRRER